MKLRQPNPEELIVSDFPLLTGGSCAVCLIVSLWAYVRASALHPVHAKTLIGPTLGALVAGVGAGYFLRRSVVHFDRRLGQASWNRWGIFGTKKGRMSLSDIKDVVVESLSDIHDTTYRVTLLTTTGRWPLTAYYSGNRTASDNMKDALRTFLGFSAQAAALSLEERLRSLVVAGQSLEAMKLAQRERSLSLANAEKLVQGLSVNRTPVRSLEERLRILVASGQTMEAITLARSEGNVPLQEAKKMVDKLSITGGSLTSSPEPSGE